MKENTVIVQKEGNYIEFRQDIDGGFIFTLLILGAFSVVALVGTVAILHELSK